MSVDVVEVFKQRMVALARIRANTSVLPALRVYYRDHVADYINDWGITVDPRNASKGLPTVMPFVLDKRQREWVDWTHQNFLEQKYGGTEKSRDVGVSWLLVAYSISICTLYDGTDVGWGSFNESKVDLLGVMGSLFEKGRTYADALPAEFSAGFKLLSSECSKRKHLYFPHTRSSIFGEIGDNIGRGNRASVYFVDETAYLEHDEMADAALSKTTNCRQDVSSVRGMDNTFAQRMHRAGINKFTFHWRENPRFTQEEYEKFLEDWGEVITAQELDINYQASVEGVVIPAKWVNAAIDAHVKLGLKEPRGEVIAALDIADQGIDKNALAMRKSYLLQHIEQWSGGGSDIMHTTVRAFNLCDKYHCAMLRYDADGFGSGVRGDARVLNEQRADRKNYRPQIAIAAHLGSGAVFEPKKQMVEGRANEDMFKNFKAQSWWALRQRFERTYAAVVDKRDIDPDDLISIPSSLPEKVRIKLCIELSQPTYSQNSSGLLIIDKQPDGKPSPNYADAICMAYAPRKKPMKIADSVFNPEEDY